jgi:aspartate racemase
MVGDDMKTIGLIGGMSWESTLEYYRIINETMKAKLGRFHSAKLILYSVDFDEVEILQHQGKWDELTAIMIDAARRVKKGGAEFLLICTNTMHKMAEDIENEAGLPLLHIVDAAAEEIKSKNIRKAGLLGTKFTMEEDFYKERLNRKHNIEVIIPEKKERDTIHRILYSELCLGVIKHISRDTFKKIIENLVGKGAEGIILGCTEIPLLVRQEDYEISLFDTTSIHAKAAVEYAIS